MNLPSAVETYTFQGRSIYVKRDDLLDEDLSGNKYRKLYKLLNTPSQNYKRIISYGGSQSNAMASIAALCKRKNWKFLYLTKTISTTLKENLEGNLKFALADGMALVEVDQTKYREAVQSLYMPTSHEEGDLILAQGGADIGAQEGVAQLAREIEIWQDKEKISKLTVVTPSGTGTTALFLARYLPHANVITTPLVGSKGYLLEQMKALASTPSNLNIIETEKKFHFAKLYPEFLDLYNSFDAQGIKFDLLYAPKTFLALQSVLDTIKGDILYVHSGGVNGNTTMLKRYEQKALRKR